MKKRVVIIAIILVIACGLLFYSSMTSGLNKNSSNNIIASGNSLNGIKKNLRWAFEVPEFVLEEENLVYKNYSNQMIEISNARMIFRAAEFINESADVIGDYNSYEFDKTYEVSGITDIEVLRYRTDGDTTIVNYHTSDISYGLKMESYDGYNGQEALINALGLLVEQLSPKEIAPVEKEVDENALQGYSEFTLDELGTIGLPESIEGISATTEKANNDTLKGIVFLEGKVLLTITKGYTEATEIYGQVNLDKEYILNYVLANPFNVGTNQYNSYNLIIESLDNIASTFRILNSTEG